MSTFLSQYVLEWLKFQECSHQSKIIKKNELVIWIAQLSKHCATYVIISVIFVSTLHKYLGPRYQLCTYIETSPSENQYLASNLECFQYYCVLRALKTSRSCSRRQTYVFQSKIAQGIQKWVQNNQLLSLPSNDFFKKLFSVQKKIIKKIGCIVVFLIFMAIYIW